jgi:hypothetical protein
MPGRVSEGKEFEKGSNAEIEHNVALKKSPIKPSSVVKSRQPHLNPVRNGKGLPKTIAINKFEKRVFSPIQVIGYDRLLKRKRSEKGHPAL